MENEAAQIIELGSPEPITLKTSSSGETNFGGGIELLMNDKRKSDGRKTPSTIQLGDIGKLEQELNELGDATAKAAAAGKTTKSVFEKVEITPPRAAAVPSEPAPASTKTLEAPIKLNAEKDKDNGKVDIAKDASKTESESRGSRTWDGFSKFGNITVDPVQEAPPKLSQEEEAKLKFQTLKKLQQLEAKGVKLTKHYTMDSSLTEMQGEHEHLVSERAKKASAKFQGRMLMAAVTGLEFLNNRFDPFDIKLDGWSEQIGEGLDDYDEIFGELHEKYKSKATMAPELKLLFQLGGSAIMVHMTNTMFKSALPGMDDIMRQNPDLAQHFSKAAAASMGSTHPGLSNFIGSVAGQDDTPDVSRGPPPPPVPPDTLRAGRDAPAMPGTAARSSRGLGTHSEGIYPSGGARREMRGPSEVTADVGKLLANLKRDTSPAPRKIAVPPDSSSTISQAEVDQLSAPARQPKSAARKTPKNTVSLDL